MFVEKVIYLPLPDDVGGNDAVEPLLTLELLDTVDMLDAGLVAALLD